VNRRSLLAAVGAGGLGALAGCSSGGVDGVRSSPRHGTTPSGTGTPDGVVTAGGRSSQSIPRPSDLSLPLPESAFTRATPRDAIPAITDPAFGRDWSGVAVTVSDRLGDGYTVEPRLRADDLVIGVARDGTARAYPLRVLYWHEVVNDTLEGPLLVTYCPLCASGITARPVVEGAATTFGVSGLLWRSDLVMYDRATDSRWSQLLATAVRGPATGTTLELVPSSLTTWADWRAAHPDTLVLRPPPESTTVRGDRSFDYTLDLDAVFRRSDGLGPARDPDPDPTPGEAFQGRVHPKTQVVGVVHGGVARAYPVTVVAERGVVNDEVGGEPIVVAAVPDTTDGPTGVLGAYRRRLDDQDADGEVLTFAPAPGPFVRAGGSRWRISTGRAVDGPHAGRRLRPASHATQLFWVAWVEFYPETQVYGLTDGDRSTG
jgi:hypothetical protein